MKTKLIAGFLRAGSCLFAAPRISIGVGAGVGVPVAPYGYVAPAPGPGFTWVAGFWGGFGPHRVWRPGYWAGPHGRYFAPRGFRQ